MVIVWRLRGNIIRIALCWIVWHNVYSQQHTYISSSYRSNRLDLSHWDPYAVHRGGCLELYYCNMVEWLWWDSSMILTTNWFIPVLWDCWFGHLAYKNRPQNDLECVEWDIKCLHYYCYYFYDWDKCYFMKVQWLYSQTWQDRCSSVDTVCWRTAVHRWTAATLQPRQSESWIH